MDDQHIFGSPILVELDKEVFGNQRRGDRVELRQCNDFQEFFLDKIKWEKESLNVEAIFR